jgi:NADPH:quinone reductase-like Zn-dependent oxidoreductase
MKAWQLNEGATGLDDLVLVERETPEPGPGEVRIRIRACSINFRDHLIVHGRAPSAPVDRAITPLSDGVGDVDAIGPGVKRVKTGDRVAGAFFPNWIDGPPGMPGPALGAPPAKGMLAEYVVLPERAVVPLASSLSFEEAATLPCSGVTAWNALMHGPRPILAGRTVLVMGTGGVSLAALQIAKAAGAHVIATSSSDEKLQRARALGADQLINYRTTPEWGAEAVRLNADQGVDHIVEVGGAGTLTQSMAAIGAGGEISLVGVLDFDAGCNPIAMMFKSAIMRGVTVGSAAMARELNRAVDTCAIKPVIDRTFPFDEAKAAFEYQASPKLFGKVVITT